MKVIIPVAGKGTRVRPHSYAKPKPLLSVAGKTAIQHLIDQMLTAEPEEFIIITDPHNDTAFRKELPKLYPNISFKFAVQERPLGTAHVIHQAKHLINRGDDIFILFCDTIFQHDLSCIKEKNEEFDGIMFSQEVEDPRRFGVVLHENRVMTGMVEKPENPTSNLVNIGAYYIKDGFRFIRYIQEAMDENIKVKGEVYLTQAFFLMIKDGRKIWVESTDIWLDVGKIETVLATNAYLLNGSIFKGENVIIENSTIGKNVAISKNTLIKNCTIENSIIGENSVLEGLTLKNSIIGDNVILKKEGTTLQISDGCSIS
jgi:glucose-1-phosphate thymidylyltransferase